MSTLNYNTVWSELFKNLRYSDYSLFAIQFFQIPYHFTILRSFTWGPLLSLACVAAMQVLLFWCQSYEQQSHEGIGEELSWISFLQPNIAPLQTLPATQAILSSRVIMDMSLNILKGPLFNKINIVTKMILEVFFKERREDNKQEW